MLWCAHCFAKGAGRMKVLIVEDNANLADVVRMGLSMEGMEAKAVYDGRDAL